MIRRHFMAFAAGIVLKPTEILNSVQGIDKKALDDAINRNVLVFDVDAKPGHLTYKLKTLMNDVLSNREYGYWKDKNMGHIVKFIICGPEVLRYYRQQAATLAYKDTTLFIGLTSTGKYLLGSY